MEPSASQWPAIAIAIITFIPLGEETVSSLKHFTHHDRQNWISSNKRPISSQAQIILMPSPDKTTISSKDTLLLLQQMGSLG